ncbi:TPA: glycosyltransferase family 2 protein [Aeromonas dhakensis]|uniref:glycosyltransferase family 2 protein n=1 Tax=Aeromonas dhakensis TaxID=196024 RepID=UPI000E3ED370|nr:glycosyltransferase family 2 protein [Aeromonas dhakensis]RFS28750.1 glycosyltransferase family 2 protein [Aeromonas dhakensis]HDX8438306.1 glycosyltransferase family 2 protein [Aeromonas dhakensis]
MEKVSVIMPLYNSARFLAASIDSVLKQKYTNWELILIDDCSGDDSVIIAQEYCDRDSRIRLVRLAENSGAAVARNHGIEVAEGRFIAFLDSDDIWLPGKLDTQIEFMLKNKVAFSYTAYKKIDAYGNDLFELGVPSSLSYRALLKACVIGCLTVIYDVSQIGKVYMPLGTKREDYALWLKILREKNIIAQGVNRVLASYRVYPHQSSSKKLTMAKENWRLLREHEKLKIFSACYFFANYACRGLIRDKFPSVAKLFRILAVAER